MDSATPGFWGVPTSTVDWCERNYQYSPWVCELFNTASSLAMVVAGVAGVLLHWRVLERRFLFAFGLVALVGVGSIAFHGTLLFQLQMLDELPMLYTVTLIVYILVENRPGRRFGRWFPAALLSYAAVTTYLCALTRGPLQFYFFQFGFGSLELASLVGVSLLYRRSADPSLRRLFRVGMAAYGLAILLWFIDLRFCEVVAVRLPALGIPNPQLHAWWHLLVSIGFYALLLTVAGERLRALGRNPEVRFRLGFLPCLRLSIAWRSNYPNPLVGKA